MRFILRLYDPTEKVLLYEMDIEASDADDIEGMLKGSIKLVSFEGQGKVKCPDGEGARLLVGIVQGHIDSTVKAMLDHNMKKLEHRFKEKQEDHRHIEHMAHSHHRHIEQAGQAESRKREVAELYHQFGKDVWKRADYDKKCEKLGCEAKSQAWCKKHYP